MNDYKDFAYYFDEIMSSIDYRDWLEYTKKFVTKDKSILDLACGSGTLLILLGILGYQDLSGLDLSNNMIDIAKEKSKMNHLLIPYYVNNMASFDLGKKFDCITCYFDSINHLPRIDLVKNMVNCVYNHLNDKGLFIFDIFSFYEFNHSEGTIKDNLSSGSYVWKIKTSIPNVINHDITIIDDNNTIHEDYQEYFYDLDDILDNRFEIINGSGDFLDFCDEKSRRVLVTARKKG